MGRASSSRLMAETMKTQGKVKDMQEKAVSLVGRGYGTIRWKKVDDIGLLLSEQSMAKWP